jgi:predicted homoserine dehydrogenase-like protein
MRGNQTTWRRGDPVRTAVIGAGMFGTGLVAQSALSPVVDVRVVADADPGRARQAFLAAGVPDQQVASCESRAEALAALDRGMCVVLEHALPAMELPVEVVVEATGSPEGGALHAREAIRHGKHLVLVNKEVDAAIGPVLKHMADREGVACLPADGDQPGLLVGLVAWARQVGLEVICGGKARVGEFVLGETAEGLSVAGVRIPPGRERFFGAIPAGAAEEFVAARREALSALEQVDCGDIEEMAVAANDTGLLPDAEQMHHALLRTTEIPAVLCHRSEGGILGCSGTVEAATCLRRADEPGLGGGVFIVVACTNAYARQFIVGKGHIANAAGTAGLIWRPYHLCGLETATSILSAASLGPLASPPDCRPRVDVVGRAKKDLPTGRWIAADDLSAEMAPAKPIAPRNALPFRMAVGARLVTALPAGRLVTADSIQRPAGSALWELRCEQDGLLPCSHHSS